MNTYYKNIRLDDEEENPKVETVAVAAMINMVRNLGTETV